MKHYFDPINTSHLIFDWDGTLMDSAHKIVYCMQVAAGLSNLPIPSAHAVHQIIGISLVPAIERLFTINSDKANEVSVQYKKAFLEQDKIACELFDGVFTGLQTLSTQYTLGIATGKARRGLERALDSSGCRQFFTNSMTADDAESKPSPQMLASLLSIWKVEPENAIMIGDTCYDMQMAEKMGMPRIGVSFGVHSKAQLLAHKPIAVVDQIDELLSILMKQK